MPYGPSDIVQSALPFCPAGQRALSGGGVNIGDEQLTASSPTNDRSGWFVIGVDLTDNGGEYVQARALCAPAGQAVAASSKRAVRAHVERLEERLGRGQARVAAVARY